MKEETKNFIYFFKEITDPRAENRSHLLEDIFTITLLGVICGCEDWDEIVLFGQSKEEFLRTFLKLPNGIASSDTFERLFKRLNPDEFENAFINWMKHICKKKSKGLISIDGKTLRGSFKKGLSKSAIHMISAWSNENQMVLGQFKVNSKTNEITAIPLLLDVLEINGSIITIDAMGCQKEIVKKVIENGADYIIGLKGNQGYLLDEVENAFNQCPVKSTDKNINKDHGRIETRECLVISDMDWISEKENWEGLKSIVKINSKREFKDHIETESRFYISSLDIDAKEMNSYVRGHWGIENSLHWVLDVIFNEDKCRMRKENSPENFSIIRRIALNLLKNNTSTKLSINKKRLKAILNEDYLLTLFTF